MLIKSIQNILRLRLSRLEEEERLHEASETTDHQTQDQKSADQETAKEEFVDANDASKVNGDCEVESVIPGSSKSYYANVEHYKRNRQYNSDDC